MMPGPQTPTSTFVAAGLLAGNPPSETSERIRLVCLRHHMAVAADRVVLVRTSGRCNGLRPSPNSGRSDGPLSRTEGRSMTRSERKFLSFGPGGIHCPCCRPYHASLRDCKRYVVRAARRARKAEARAQFSEWQVAPAVEYNELKYEFPDLFCDDTLLEFDYTLPWEE